MVVINYPSPNFKIKEEKGKEMIFDTLRKKWVALTPEEWVRQNFIQYLLQEKQYPASMIAVEKEIRLGELKKRFDILVYNDNHQPWMMIECKAMEVVLDEPVLQQLLRYNISTPVSFMVITNGTGCMAWKKVDASLQSLSELPWYNE
jgi:hypothetical protein